MENIQWWYEKDGQQYGPMPQDHIKSLISAGTLTTENLVWKEGLSEWVPIGKTYLKNATVGSAEKPSLKNIGERVIVRVVTLVVFVIILIAVIWVADLIKGKHGTKQSGLGNDNTSTATASQQVQVTENNNGNVKIAANPDWKTFTHQYGYALDLPGHSTEGALTASGIQYYGDSDYGDRLSIAVENLGNDATTSQALKKFYAEDAATFSDGYMKFAEDWYVVSGIKNNTVYYKKVIAGKNINALEITYSLNDTAMFNPIVGRISKSFHLIQ